MAKDGALLGGHIETRLAAAEAAITALTARVAALEKPAPPKESAHAGQVGGSAPKA
jgi:hypothetical protein